MRLTKRSNVVTIASKVFLSIDTISIYFSFDVIVPFTAKEHIIRYPTMASLKVAAYCADTAAIVRGHHTETALFA